MILILLFCIIQWSHNWTNDNSDEQGTYPLPSSLFFTLHSNNTFESLFLILKTEYLFFLLLFLYCEAQIQEKMLLKLGLKPQQYVRINKF